MGIGPHYEKASTSARLDTIPYPLSQTPGLKAAQEQFPLTAMDSIVAVLLQNDRQAKCSKNRLTCFYC